MKQLLSEHLTMKINNIIDNDYLTTVMVNKHITIIAMIDPINDKLNEVIKIHLNLLTN